MKSILHLLFFFCSFSFSQTLEATLHFKDGGESIKGLGDIYQGNKIKFRLDENGETSIWTGDVVKGITFHEFERDINYEYTYTKSFKRTPQLLEVLVFGEVTLYCIRIEVNSSNWIEYGKNFVHDSPYQYKVNKYFVKRESEPFATRLRGNFKKRIREYFGECVGIEKRIKNHEFRWSTLPELVTYYNNFCVDF